MRITARIIILAALLFIPSCGSQSGLSTGGAPEYVTEAQKEYGPGCDFLFNSDSTYVLCVQRLKATPKHPVRSINFFVYDIRRKEKIWEESLPDGSVDWQNARLLKVVRVSEAGYRGREKANQTIEYYDVKSRRIIPRGKNEIKNAD